ncbi:MAG: hypothetical protein R2712_27980 [Vicinamibacterales bacterium]
MANIAQVFWVDRPTGRPSPTRAPRSRRIWGRPCAELYRSPDLYLTNILRGRPAARRAPRSRLLRSQSFEVESRIRRCDGSVRLILDRGYRGTARHDRDVLEEAWQPTSPNGARPEARSTFLSSNPAVIYAWLNRRRRRQRAWTSDNVRRLTGHEPTVERRLANGAGTCIRRTPATSGRRMPPTRRTPRRSEVPPVPRRRRCIWVLDEEAARAR